MMKNGHSPNVKAITVVVFLTAWIYLNLQNLCCSCVFLCYGSSFANLQPAKLNIGSAPELATVLTLPSGFIVGLELVSPYPYLKIQYE